MLVQCPNCKTTYKVSDDVLKGSTPAFRCSRCRHTFELETEAAEQPDAAEASVEEATPPASDPELSFTYAEKPDETVVPIVSPEPTVAAHAAEAIPPQTAAEPEPWSMEMEAAEAEPHLTLPQVVPIPAPAHVVESAAEFADHKEPPPSDGQVDETDDSDNILPMTSYMDQQASILPYLTLFGLLAIGFSLLAVFSYSHSKASEEFLRKIPLLGASVLKNNHLKDSILLRSVRGGYQTIERNREVFVITGVAVNQNPVVIREIQLAGKLFNDAGKEMEQQTIWIGNTLSAKILRGTTLEEIPNLQNLKPLSFKMPPGESLPFTMVFLKSAKSAKDFICEVAFAESEV
ncbi:MAG: hypothetical protein EXR70_15440 [Deltaproteobacteria bacterium]|nr:hypothetical protein [Deltaproteobacteria bacterium]